MVDVDADAEMGSSEVIAEIAEDVVVAAVGNLEEASAVTAATVATTVATVAAHAVASMPMTRALSLLLVALRVYPTD